MTTTVDRSVAVPAVTIVGIALASALVPLNSTMIAVALPTLSEEFGISTGRAGVLITVYLMAMLVGQPIAGRIADGIGARRLAIIAVSGFGLCSAAAMFASTFAVLVGLRAGQAVFASALAPSVQSLLRAVTGSSGRGRAFGLQGSVMGVGAGLGPVIGGVLLAVFGWHAIFAINIPIVIFVLVVLQRSVGADVDGRARAVAPLAAMGERRAGAGDAVERVLTPVFTAAFATQALATLAQYSLLLIAPVLLDDRGWSTGAIGVALSTLTLGMIVMSPPGGKLGDAWGRRRPVLIGLAVATLAVGLTVPFGSDVASAVLIVSLLLFGLGLGVAAPSITTAGIEASPESRTGLAAGLLSMSRYVGSIVGSMMLTALVGDDTGGVGTMLLVSFVALTASLLTATRLPSSQRARSDTEDLDVEISEQAW